jgi:hypothetical protein
MRHVITLVSLTFFLALGAGLPAAAQQDGGPDGMIMSADDANLSDFKWKKRVLVVFGESRFEPQYAQQMEYIRERRDALARRDVVVLTDTAADGGSALREELRPHGFMLVLVGKDGNIYLRKPLPWTVREISNSIDKLPIRQKEMREQGGAS